MARPLKPFVRGGGYYPSRKWTPLVYNGGYTTKRDGSTPPTPEYWKTVTGISPLALVNSLAKPLRSLTRYGKCTQPAAPMYSTITQRGKCEQRNLPRGYTELEYIEIGTSGVWFPTGVVADLDAEIEFTGSNVTSASSQLAVARCQSGADYFRIAKATATQNIVGTIGAQTLTATGVDGVAKFHAKLNRDGFWVNGEKVGTFSATSLSGVGEIDLLRGVYGASIYYSYTGARLHDARARNTSQSFDAVACRRDSDNALGLYDYASNAFVPPRGNGALTAGPAVTVPSPEHSVDIWCNNGVLRVKNLFDYEYFYDNYQTQPNSTVGRCPIKLKPNTAYTVSTNKNTSAGNSVIFVVSGNSIDWNPSTANNGVLANSPRTVTTDSNGYLCFGIYVRDVNAIPESDFTNGTVWVQIEQGSSATPYMPYGQIYVDGTPETLTVGGQTVAVADLFAVGTYADSQELIAGIKTGKVGIVRLSPDWTWLKSGTYTGSFYTNTVTGTGKKSNDPTALCTHGFQVNSLSEYSAAGIGAFYWYSATTINYKFDDGTATVEQFKQFLTDNVALVLYPLATETAEQLSPADIVRTYPQTITATTNVGDVTITETHADVSTPSPRTPLPIWCNNGKLVYSNGSVVPDGTPETLTIGGGSLVPEGYTELKTVRNADDSNFDAYVETGVTLTSIFNTKLTVKNLRLADSDTPGSFAVGGADGGATGSKAYGLACAYGQLEYCIGENQGVANFAFDNAYHDVVLEIDGSGNVSVSVDGTPVETQHTTTVDITGDSIPITLVSDPVMFYAWPGDIGEVTLEQNGVTLFDCVPTERDSDDVVGFYDVTASAFRVQSGGDPITAGDPAPASGQTVSVAELLGVGDYTDAHEIIEGILTHKVGVKVLTGAVSEEWAEYATGDAYIRGATAAWGAVAGVAPICNRLVGLNAGEDVYAGACRFATDFNVYDYKATFGVSGLAEFRAKLAAYADAGKPLMLIYARATETTEQLTPQPVDSIDGTTIITSSSPVEARMRVVYESSEE